MSKKTKTQIARGKAWKAFSEYIRRRDKGTCVTCGARDDWKNMNAGHYRHGKFDFDEMNVNCQCPRCNHFLSGALDKYTFYLIDKFGEQAVREFREKDEISDKRTPEEWLKLAEEYRKKIEAQDWN